MDPSHSKRDKPGAWDSEDVSVEVHSARRKVLVYVGDGGGTCRASGITDETQYLTLMVAQVTSQNFQRVTINCVGVLMQGRTNQERFMKQLSSQNGGTYRRIN